MAIIFLQVFLSQCDSVIYWWLSDRQSFRSASWCHHICLFLFSWSGEILSLLACLSSHAILLRNLVEIISQPMGLYWPHLCIQKYVVLEIFVRCVFHCQWFLVGKCVSHKWFNIVLVLHYIPYKLFSLV